MPAKSVKQANLMRMCHENPGKMKGKKKCPPSDVSAEFMTMKHKSKGKGKK